MNRVCSNSLLSATADDADYPVGSASVKEMFDPAGRELVGYAIYVRVHPEDAGDSWFWYEVGEEGEGEHEEGPGEHHGKGDEGAVAGFGIAECVACHGAAAKPYVWTQVRP
jgi:hypothetical protein